jgi:hypothetical protein
MQRKPYLEDPPPNRGLEWFPQPNTEESESNINDGLVDSDDLNEQLIDERDVAVWCEVLLSISFTHTVVVNAIDTGQGRCILKYNVG